MFLLCDSAVWFWEVPLVSQEKVIVSLVMSFWFEGNVAWYGSVMIGVEELLLLLEEGCETAILVHEKENEAVV